MCDGAMFAGNGEVCAQVLAAGLAEPVVQLLSSTVDIKHEVRYSRTHYKAASWTDGASTYTMLLSI